MSRIKMAALAGLAVFTLGWTPLVTRAGDTHATTTPALLQTTDSQHHANVQLVRGGWGVGFGGPGGGFYVGRGGGWYGGGYRGYYGGYGGYYRPYYGGYYGGYGYPGYYNAYPYYGGYYSPGYYW